MQSSASCTWVLPRTGGVNLEFIGSPDCLAADTDEQSSPVSAEVNDVWLSRVSAGFWACAIRRPLNSPDGD